MFSGSEKLKKKITQHSTAAALMIVCVYINHVIYVKTKQLTVTKCETDLGCCVIIHEAVVAVSVTSVMGLFRHDNPRLHEWFSRSEPV